MEIEPRSSNFWADALHQLSYSVGQSHTYLGKWYEAERYFALFELGGKCVVANYSDNGEGIYGIVNRQISSLTGIKSSIEGEARVVGRSDESKLSVRFPSLPALWMHHTENYTTRYSISEKLSINQSVIFFFHAIRIVPFDAPYWILDTDYDNYAVVWSCTDFGLFNTRNAWILTREKHPSLEVMQKAYAVLDKSGVSRAFFIRTDQRNCPVTH
ncbi:hypothetical protein J437_LFUL005398 [Ladona fulva]|uniref:Lipocalin/cytosolic fatty-acid binding domain-containing protein n=1 Tax=Ladona fulva TaxID=123851 RepID=A0A8K0K4T7_LADFU|nr:hypothetical protein J437_LFUL005398 [Ladona fulva]